MGEGISRFYFHNSVPRQTAKQCWSQALGVVWMHLDILLIALSVYSSSFLGPLTL